MRKKVFCWIPKNIYLIRYWRYGFRWLSFAWLDEDGKHYATKEVLQLNHEYVKKHCKT